MSQGAQILLEIKHAPFTLDIIVPSNRLHSHARTLSSSIEYCHYVFVFLVSRWSQQSDITTHGKDQNEHLQREPVEVIKRVRLFLMSTVRVNI
jgi:hypothetical protein